MSDHPPVRYCTRCRAEVPPERVARGSAFCGNDCRNSDKKERRAHKASRSCRLCGRAAKRPKVSRQQVAPADSPNPCATVAQGNLLTTEGV